MIAGAEENTLLTSAAVQEKKAAKGKGKAEAEKQKEAVLRLLPLLCLGSETRDKGGAEPETNKDKVGTHLLQHCPTLMVLYLPPLLSSLSSSLRNLHNMALFDPDSCVQRAACRCCFRLSLSLSVFQRSQARSAH